MESDVLDRKLASRATSTIRPSRTMSPGRMGDGSLLAGAWLVKTSGKTRLTLSLLAGLLVLCINASSAMAADIFAPPSEGCENLMAQSTNLCVQGNRNTLGVYLQELVDAHSSGQPSSGGGSSSVDAQRALETADNTPDPRALAYEEWARCKAQRPRVRCGKRAWISTPTRG